MMYEENPNLRSVREAYEDYYSSHDFIKNKDTQFYKRWLKKYMHQTDKEGNILKPSAVSNTQFLQNKSAMPPGSPWEEMGPWQYDHEAALLHSVQSPGCAHVYTVEQAPSNGDIVFAGTATAGLWKSTDKGMSWSLMTRDMIIGTVYAIAIDPINPNLVYFGEGNGKIWKSTNGGNTWSMTGNASFQSMDLWTRDLKISPINPQVILAATNTALYQSTDGGNNWTQKIAGECMEIEFQPGNQQTVFVVSLSGSATKFWRSTNSGNTFAQTSTGWPAPADGDEQKRCEIAVTPANPNIVYVLASGFADSYGGLYGIYLSTDAGLTFNYQCCGTGPGGVPTPGTNPNILGWSEDGSGDGGQYYYDLAMGASPTDPDKIFAAGIDVWRSENAGVDWTINAHWVTWVGATTHDRYTHADVHDIKFFESPGGWDMWIASDGGLYYSSDEGDHTEPRMYGIHGTDFWGFQAGYQDGDVMLGGTYHNGTLIKYKDIYKYGATDENSGGWMAEGAGDNVRGFVNYGNNKVAYDDGGSFEFSEDRLIRPANLSFDGNYRCNTSYVSGEYGNYEWDPNCYNIFYSPVGTNLHQTQDGGLTWDLIHTFAGEKLIQVKTAPSDPNTIYCTVALGYWDHVVWRSTDGGVNWTDITPASGITGNNSWRHKYVAVDGYDSELIWCILIGGQTGNKVFRSANGGSSWTNYTGASTLLNENCVSIVHQLGTDEGLYIGTRHGVFYRNASMADWELYSTDLPARTSSFFLDPFYGEGKIRVGSNRGVYQCDFYESSSPIARVAADKRDLNIGSSCIDQFVEYVDHSVLLVNANTTWEWTFEGGLPASSSDRNPIVQYPNAGLFDVTLTVTDDNGTHSIVMDDFIEIMDIKEDFPVLEDFETTFPPEKWTLYNPGTSSWEWDWIPDDEANNKAASYPNYWVNATGMTTQMILPAMDFSNAESPEFSFDYTHRTYGDNVDGLAIRYRTGNNPVWQTIWEVMDPALNVSGTDIWWWYSSGSNVTWQNMVLDLSFLEGESCVELAVENIGGNGNHIWVDNISITTKPNAEFEADQTDICVDDVILLTDQSSNDPDSWTWTITPSDFVFINGTDANSVNPEIQFTAEGDFTIALEVSNIYGNDIEEEIDYINVSICTCPGDFNGDLSSNISDLLILLAEFGNCNETCLSDMDGNGVVDAADLLQFLAFFGTDCLQIATRTRFNNPAKRINFVKRCHKRNKKPTPK